jgi:hypothetical protein
VVCIFETEFEFGESGLHKDDLELKKRNLESLRFDG